MYVILLLIFLIDNAIYIWIGPGLP